MSVEFDTPANRVISQFQPKNKFRIDTSLPDLTFLRQLSVQGRLRYFQQDLSSADLVITPPTGETFFLFRIIAVNVHATILGNLKLTNTGNTRLDAVLPAQIAAVQNNGFTFEILDSLVGDGTINMTFAQTQGTVRISVFGWVENTSRIRDVTT